MYFFTFLCLQIFVSEMNRNNFVQHTLYEVIRTGGLKEYWDAIWQHDALAGGYIWDWIDQGLLDEERKYGKKSWNYGGDYEKGEHNDQNFCTNGVSYNFV